MKKRSQFPKGWDEARVRAVLDHYESQTEDEAVAEDEAAFRRRGQTVMVVPTPLVPAITRLITKRGAFITRGHNTPPLQPPSSAHRLRSAKSGARAARG